MTQIFSNYINGEWVKGPSLFEDRNPADTSVVIGSFVKGSAQDVEAAASAAPLSAWRIVEALHEAGVPKGVVNFVAGSGGELGQALVDAKPLKAVSFTGSCQIGNWLHAEASKRRLRIQLEMGGKNPTIVLGDADFGAAVENVTNAAFFSTGQKCTATSRAIVEDSIYDRFVAAVVERAKKLKVGNGMEPGIEMGPCVDQAQMETVLRYIEIGRKETGPPK